MSNLICDVPIHPSVRPLPDPLTPVPPSASLDSPTTHLMHPVERRPLYIGTGNQALFAWYHTADNAASPRDCVTVLCNPLGHEYVHSHRSMRCLADELASAGMPTLRFDYHGTGDSPGTDLDAERLTRWRQDIETAIDEARALSGRARVCLLGIRMGASLALLSSVDRAVDSLVLWGPAVSGRRYVRELQAIARLAEMAPSIPSGADALIESAGFMLSSQTADEFKALNLLKLTQVQAGRVLIVGRDDIEGETGLPEHLRSLGVEVQTLAGSGFAGMMAEPHQGVVPSETIGGIVDWLRRQNGALPPAARAAVPAGSACQDVNFDFITTEGRRVPVVESPAQFGEHRSLFGIHSRPLMDDDNAASTLPTVILFSSGAVHRIGPSRLYTLMARNLAARGYPCFRCDLEGLGDSVSPIPGLEGHPYPPTAVRDARAIIEFVSRRHGAASFVLAGLCSGAYTAFQAALAVPDQPIHGVMLINPLIFAYDGQEIPDVQSFRIAESSKVAMRRLDSWKKLARGQIRVGYVLGMALRYFGKSVGSHVRTLAERVTVRAATLLSRQLQQLFAKRRRVTLVLATGEAGWRILQAGARRTAALGAQRGDLRLVRIAESDHTFSTEGARLRLLEAVIAQLDQDFKSGQGAPARHAALSRDADAKYG